MEESEKRNNDEAILAIARSWHYGCIFEPTEDSDALFEIKESNTNVSHIHGSIVLRTLKDRLDRILRLGILRDEIFEVDNKDGISWESARYIISSQPGSVVHLGDKDQWIVSEKIHVTLAVDYIDNITDSTTDVTKEPIDKISEIKDNINNEIGLNNNNTKSNDDSEISTVSPKCENESEESSATINNEENENLKISKIDNNLDKGITKEETAVEEPKITENNSAQVFPSVDLNSFQYLKAGRDPMNFFLEGSSEDKGGAYYEVRFDQNNKAYGQLSIITSIDNIKTIDEGFRKKTIKIVNNDTTLRESKGFTEVEKGELVYNSHDKVWFIKLPVKIKLNK